MATKFSKTTGKQKFGKHKFGEVKDYDTLKNVNMTSPNWKHDTITVTNWKTG